MMGFLGPGPAVAAELQEAKAKLDAVYTERNLVVALAAKLALMGPTSFAWLGRHDPADTSWDDDWRNVVFISIADPFDGHPIQLSWHIHDSELGLFNFLPNLCLHTPLAPGLMNEQGAVVARFAWDGHTTEEKYDRIRRFVGALGAVPQADGASQPLPIPDLLP